MEFNKILTIKAGENYVEKGRRFLVLGARQLQDMVLKFQITDVAGESCNPQLCVSRLSLADL